VVEQAGEVDVVALEGEGGVEDVVDEGVLGKVCLSTVELGELAPALVPVRVLADLGGGKVCA